MRERQTGRRSLLIRSMSFRLVIPGGLLFSSARFRFANHRALSEKPSAQTSLFFSRFEPAFYLNNLRQELKGRVQSPAIRMMRETLNLDLSFLHSALS